MGRANIIRALEAEGLHVEASGNEVRGLAGGTVVVARYTGRDWKMRTDRRASVGSIVRTEEEARRWTRRATSPAVVPYFDGVETFALRHAEVAR